MQEKGLPCRGLPRLQDGSGPLGPSAVPHASCHASPVGPEPLRKPAQGQQPHTRLQRLSGCSYCDEIQSCSSVEECCASRLLVSWDKEASRLVHFQRDCECARYCTEQGVVQVVCTCTMLGNSVQLPTERRECRTFLANLGICSSDTSWGRAGGGGAAA